MKWFSSRSGAITLSVIALLTEVWRGFLDAMFVLPVDFDDPVLMQGAALIFTVLFAGWTWSLLLVAQNRRGGFIAASIINAVVLLGVPVSWLIAYCPGPCRAEAGIFNLANSLNLGFGLLAAVALGLQFRSRPQIASGI